jgi:hypothetical protein
MKTRTQQILHCTAGSRAGRFFAGALSLAIWISSAAANQAADAPAPSATKLERITEFFNNEVATGKLPGAVVLIQQHGKPVYLKCFGVQDVTTKIPMTSDTIFALHSMTKPITSVAVMMLIDAGKLSLRSRLQVHSGFCRRHGGRRDRCGRWNTRSKVRPAGPAGDHHGFAAAYVGHHLRLHRRQADRKGL